MRDFRNKTFGLHVSPSEEGVLRDSSEGAVLGGVLQEDLTHSGLLSTFGASHGAWNSPWFE